MRRPCSLQPRVLQLSRPAAIISTASAVRPQAFRQMAYCRHTRKFVAHGGFNLKKPFIAFRGCYEIQVVEKMLSDGCQQASVFFSQLCRPLERGVRNPNPLIRIAGGLTKLVPSPCVFRSNCKQCLDCLCGICVLSQLKLSPGEHQTQLEAGRETANAFNSYARAPRHTAAVPTEGQQARGGSGKFRVCGHSPAE